MLSLTDLDATALDPDLRLLIDRLTDTDAKVFVVQGGDTPEVINKALGFHITGDQAEEPTYDWIKNHGRWFEIAYAERSLRVFIENDPGTELGIHYLCLSHFWAET